MSANNSPDPTIWKRERYCRQCGLEIDKIYKFCPSCGAKIVKVMRTEPAENDSKMLSVVVVIALVAKPTSATASLPGIMAAVVQEVESFYNHDKNRVSIETQSYYSRQALGQLEISKKRKFESFDRQDIEHTSARFTGLYDQWKLVHFFERRFSDDFRPLRDNEKFVVITDLEITPFGQLRYILWDWEDNKAVISLATMNPEYWEQKDRYLPTTIKHRVRTSCLHIIGGFLGLDKCQNAGCFRYANIDSVTRLDDMICLGKEHGIEGLASLGFSVRTKDPSMVQRIESNPRPLQETQR